MERSAYETLALIFAVFVGSVLVSNCLAFMVAALLKIGVKREQRP
jgi:hypothetical protein